MEGVIKGHTFWFCVPSYSLPVIVFGLGLSETVKALPVFLFVIACSPERNDIVMLGMGVGEVGT